MPHTMRESPSKKKKRQQQQEGRDIDMVNARRLCRGAARNPHPHPIDIHAHISFPLLVHGHVHAIRDNTEQLARHALHRKRIPTPPRRQPRPGRSRSRRRDNVEQGERVAAVRAQHTARCDVHVVPFSAPSLVAYHVCECTPDALSGVGICAPTIESLDESGRARGG